MAVKFSTLNMLEIKENGIKNYCNNLNIFEFEICGYIFDINSKSFLIRDVFGEWLIYKSADLIVNEGISSVKVKILHNNTKISFYTKNIVVSTIYEELSSNIEIIYMMKYGFFITQE